MSALEITWVDKEDGGEPQIDRNNNGGGRMLTR
jgi:hypothetical protein